MVQISEAFYHVFAQADMCVNGLLKNYRELKEVYCYCLPNCKIFNVIEKGKKEENGL